MDLDEMMRLAEEQARRVLLGTKDELCPTWLLVKPGHIEILGTPWSGDEGKHLAVEGMRTVMRRRNIEAYSLLVEAWFATEPAPIREYTGPRPSERPDRREAVVIMAANKRGEHRHCHFEIIRDKQGRCKELRRLGGPEDQITSALFDNLLADNRGRAN